MKFFVTTVLLAILLLPISAAATNLELGTSEYDGKCFVLHRFCEENDCSQWEPIPLAFPTCSAAEKFIDDVVKKLKEPRVERGFNC